MIDFFKNMTDEEIEEFKNNCISSDKFFYNNYIKKLSGNEILPSYSKEAFKKYQEIASGKRQFIFLRPRTSTPRPIFIEKSKIIELFPLTPKEVFKSSNYLYEPCNIGKQNMCRCKSEEDCNKNNTKNKGSFLNN